MIFQFIYDHKVQASRKCTIKLCTNATIMGTTMPGNNGLAQTITQLCESCGFLYSSVPSFYGSVHHNTLLHYYSKSITYAYENNAPRVMERKCKNNVQPSSYKFESIINYL